MPAKATSSGYTASVILVLCFVAVVALLLFSYLECVCTAAGAERWLGLRPELLLDTLNRKA